MKRRPLGLVACLLLVAACDNTTPAASTGTDQAVADGAPVAAPPEAVEQVTTRGDAPKRTGRPKPPPLTDESGPRLLTRVLEMVVTDDGLVRYDMFKDRELLGALERVVTWYDSTEVPPDRSEKLAFLCNAYNANVLARAYRESVKSGFESVVKVPGFFDSRPIRVGRESMTLNDLENKKIRPLGDARIHAALVCAAMSCPPLRNEPYVAARLDEQFDDQCKRWVNDQTKFRLVGGKLGLSEILNWYGDDFNKAPYSTPVGFVLAYADPSGAVARYIANTGSPATTWIEYDWSLNNAK